jgi:hypothetical protein
MPSGDHLALADLHEQLLVDSGGNTFVVYNDEVGLADSPSLQKHVLSE